MKLLDRDLETNGRMAQGVRDRLLGFRAVAPHSLPAL